MIEWAYQICSIANPQLQAVTMLFELASNQQPPSSQNMNSIISLSVSSLSATCCAQQQQLCSLIKREVNLSRAHRRSYPAPSLLEISTNLGRIRFISPGNLYLQHRGLLAVCSTTKDVVLELLQEWQLPKGNSSHQAEAPILGQFLFYQPKRAAELQDLLIDRVKWGKMQLQNRNSLLKGHLEFLSAKMFLFEHCQKNGINEVLQVGLNSDGWISRTLHPKVLELMFVYYIARPLSTQIIAQVFNHIRIPQIMNYSFF